MWVLKEIIIIFFLVKFYTTVFNDFFSLDCRDALHQHLYTIFLSSFVWAIFILLFLFHSYQCDLHICTPTTNIKVENICIKFQNVRFKPWHEHRSAYTKVYCVSQDANDSRRFVCGREGLVREARAVWRHDGYLGWRKLW